MHSASLLWGGPGLRVWTVNWMKSHDWLSHIPWVRELLPAQWEGGCSWLSFSDTAPPPHSQNLDSQFFDAFENTPFVFLLSQGGLVWITSPPSFQVCVPSVDRHSPLDLPVTAPFVEFTGLKLSSNQVGVAFLCTRFWCSLGSVWLCFCSILLCLFRRFLFLGVLNNFKCPSFMEMIYYLEYVPISVISLRGIIRHV